MAHLLVDGFALPELAGAFDRALTLSRRVVSPSTLVPALAGLWNYHLTAGDLKKAKLLATRLQKLTREKHASGHVMVACNATAWTNWFLGRFESALPHIDKVSTAYNVKRHRSLSILFGEDPGVAAHMCGAVTNLMLGSIEAAERHIADGRDIAQALNQPFGLAQILWAELFIAHQLGDPVLVEERAATLIATGRIFLAWAQSERGDIRGLENLATSIQAWRATAVRITLPAMLALYAEACLKHQRWAEADEALSEALALIRGTGERWYEAEVHRLRGELARQSGKETHGSAPEQFRLAVRVAEHQGHICSSCEPL